MSHNPDLRDNVFVYQAPAVVQIGGLGNGIEADRRYVLHDPVLRVIAGMDGGRAHSV